MDKQPARHSVRTQKVSFSNGNEALVVTPQANAQTSHIIQALHVPTPSAVILVAGGAAEMRSNVATQLIPLFTTGVAELAASLDALIIDGGTQAGVMALMGQGVAERQHRSTLLGIAPMQTVAYPGKVTATDNTDAEELVPLDPNHSHFVLVEADEWGGETETMYALAAHFSQHSPSVAVLADGGHIARQELLYNVRQRRPIVIIEGSGRLADKIAQLWRARPASFDDAESAEIITQGNIHLFPLFGSSSDFAQLLHGQLQRR
ncbi:MAG: hypothetical protein NVS2B12_35200 [Ktedonobacteraceae bacterium]